MQLIRLTSRYLPLVLFLGLCLGACSPRLPEIAGEAYFIDCADGNDHNDGTSPGAAWRSLEKVNATRFTPGDGIFFKRGTTCEGSLWPKGSGEAGKPITLAAYGKGALPIIKAGDNEQALKLYDQQYWHIQELETSGGKRYGIYIGGSENGGSLYHLYLKDLVVHDVYGDAVDSKATGLVVFLPGGGDNRFVDVVVDGVTAYNTDQWAGITILGSNQYPADFEDPGFGEDIIIRNSTVYNTYGDGITVFYARKALIETNVAYDTGQQPPPQTIGTPSSIWTWSCYDCIVQYNESYRADTPDVDGGCYDIDWGTRNNLYQYNYGHDCSGYCISVFGAGGLTTVNSIARYNICANNGRVNSLAARQGDIFLSTWDNGHLDGVMVYNNTFFWNPDNPYSALVNIASFTGSRQNLFANNIIYSTVPWLVDSNASLQLDYNLYWYTPKNIEEARLPVWLYAGKAYTGFEEYQRESRQDENSLYGDPLLSQPTYHEIGRPGDAFLLQENSPAIEAGLDLGGMGEFDFFGFPIPYGATYDIGANEWQGEAKSIQHDYWQFGDLFTKVYRDVIRGDDHRLADWIGKPLLLSFIQLDRGEYSRTRNPSHSQVVFLRSLAHQYGGQGLNVVFVGGGHYAQDESARDDLLNMAYNWQIQDLPVLMEILPLLAAGNDPLTRFPTTFLLAADGRILQRWDGLATTAQLSFAVQELFHSDEQ